MPGVTRQGLDKQAGHPCPSIPTAHGPQTYTSAGQSKVFSDGALVVNKNGSAFCGDPVDEVSSKVFAGFTVNEQGGQTPLGVHRLGDATVGEGCFNPSTSAGGSSKVFADDATVPEVVTYPYQDQDGDGIINMEDEFPFDFDNDGIEDINDDDDDNDGVLDVNDADPLDPDVQ